LPTGPLTSKHVTSGTTRETTPATTTNNNNNSPPSESLASDSTDVSRGSSDITDQSARVRPSPAGKRARKGTSSGGRAARALPGPGDMVEPAGATRRAAPVAGKLSLSATSSPLSLIADGGGSGGAGGTATGPVMSENNSSRKQTALTSMSTSLTNVAAKTEPGGSDGSPELVRRKATTSSRLAIPRAPGRLPKAPRPASDGGGTTAGSASNHGLGSKLPSVVSGSVGAISDGTVQVSARKLQPQHSSKSDHPRRPVISPSSTSSSSSPGRLSELRVQFGLTHDMQHVVAADLPSPTTRGVPAATCETAHDMECLPDGQGEIPDRLEDQQRLSQNHGECQNVADCPKKHQGLVDSHGYNLNMSDWHEKILPDKQEHHQNTQENYCHDQNNSDGQLSHGVSLTVPYEQENYPCLTDKQDDCDENNQNLSDEDREPGTVPDDQESRGHSDGDEQFVMCQGREVTSNTALTYRDVERMTTTCDDHVDTVSCETSRDVILASSVVTTTADATASTYNHSTSVSGKYAVMIQVKFIADHPGVRQAFYLYLYANLGFISGRKRS